jgi:hypothetical protein
MSGVQFPFENGDTMTAGDFAGVFAECQPFSATLGSIVAQGGAPPPFVQPGTWTPVDASGGTLTLGTISAEYGVIGNVCLLSGKVTYPSNSSTLDAAIGGFPYDLPNQGYANSPDILFVNGGAACSIVAIQNTNSANIYSLSTGSPVTNATLSGKTVNFQIAFPLT